MGEHSISRDETPLAGYWRDDEGQDRSGDLPSDQPKEVHAWGTIPLCKRETLPSGAELPASGVARLQGGVVGSPTKVVDGTDDRGRYRG